MNNSDFTAQLLEIPILESCDRAQEYPSLVSSPGHPDGACIWRNTDLEALVFIFQVYA